MTSLNEFAQYPKGQEILFFGGTFHPWHKGHEACLKLAPKDSVIYVVPDRNPFKEITSRNANAEYAIIQKELKKIPHPRLKIYGDFLYKEEINPTYYWLKKIHEQFPHLKISLLMGFDSFVSLPNWIQAPELLKILHALYVVSRSDQERLKIETLLCLEEMNKNLEIKFLGNHNYEHLSSTELREQKKREP